MFTFIPANNPQKLHVKYNNNMLCLNTAHYVLPIYVINKKTPEGVYAGCVGVSKDYVEWHWKVEQSIKEFSTTKSTSQVILTSLYLHACK